MNRALKNTAAVNSAVSLAISFLLLVAGFSIKDDSGNRSYIYKNGRILDGSLFGFFETILDAACILVLLLVIASTVTCIVYRIRSKARITKRLMFSWLATFVSFGMLLCSDLLYAGLFNKIEYDPKCYEFTDGRHTIVIEEESFLLYGGGTIYQIYDDSTAVVIGTISTDDGGRNNGNYDIQWFDDHAQITYNNFVSNGSTTVETVEFHR